jgi:VanZ like family
MVRGVPGIPRWNNIIALAIIAGGMGMGLTFPFEFRATQGELGPAHALLQTWFTRWSMTDFIANVILFLPFGFFAAGAFPARIGMFGQWLLAVLMGAAFSTACETIQYYEPARVTSLSDVVSNSLGTALGAAVGVLADGQRRMPWGKWINPHPIPLLLLGSWLFYRLYPYIPVADLHKYWDALKPLVLNPELSAYGIFHYAVMWLTVAAMIEAITGSRRSWLVFPILAAGVFFGKIVILSTVLTIDEVVGAGAAYAVWLALLALAPRRRSLLVALALLAYIVAWRLEPFEFGPQLHAFRWLPFFGFMGGSLGVNTQSFLEKAFYYGSLIWLIAQAGARLPIASMIAVLVLLITSGLEVYLPDRSAGATDAWIALILSVLMGLATPRPARTGEENRTRPPPVDRAGGYGAAAP